MTARTPRRGDRFEHSRFIVGSPKAGTARPDQCTVTKVVHKPTPRVWYQNESGMKFRIDLDRMEDIVGRWLDRNEADAR